MNVATRKNVVRFFCQRAIGSGIAIAYVDAAEIYAAVANLDDWFDAAPVASEATNQAQMIAALPPEFSAGSNAAQKAILLAGVALGRTGAL